MNIPNLISFGRLASMPVIVWLVLNSEMRIAFWVFVIAAASDAVDGIIAKTFDAETVLGAYLDPLADKALLVGTYVMLGYAGHLPMWLVILVAFRDLVIIGGAILFHTITQSLNMRPLLASKVNTFLQLVLAIVVLGVRGYDLGQDGAIEALTWVVGATTLWTGIVYVVQWSQRAALHEEETAAGPGDAR